MTEEYLDELPPPYSPGPARERQKLNQISTQGHETGPNLSKTFSAIEQQIEAAKHSYEFCQPTNTERLRIRAAESGDILFFVNWIEGPSTTISLCHRRLAPIAKAEIASSCDDIKVSIHRSDHSLRPTEITAHHSRKSFLQAHRVYHFEIGETPYSWKCPNKLGLDHTWVLYDDTLVGQPATGTHSRAQATTQNFVGSKLIVGGARVAVYRPGWFGKEKEHNRNDVIQWESEVTWEVEAVSMLVLIGIVEKSRKIRQQ